MLVAFWLVITVSMPCAAAREAAFNFVRMPPVPLREYVLIIKPLKLLVYDLHKEENAE